MARTEKQWAEAKELQAKLAAQGILAIYGGDKKGHGFWLYPAGPEALKRWEETRGYTHLDDCGPCMQTACHRSGNPCFTMFEDAAKLIEQV